jgi:hypothetical protein
MVYLEGMQKLMQKALDLQTSRDVLEFRSPADRIRVFLETELPREFWLQGEQLPSQQGRCLFSVELLVESQQ